MLLRVCCSLSIIIVSTSTLGGLVLASQSEAAAPVPDLTNQHAACSKDSKENQRHLTCLQATEQRHNTVHFVFAVNAVSSSQEAAQ